MAYFHYYYSASFLFYPSASFRILFFFFLMTGPPPISTLFPYPPLSRSPSREAPAGGGEAAGGAGPPPGQSQARVDGCRVVHVESCGRVAPQAGGDEQLVPPGELLLQHEAEGGRDRAQPLLTDTERTPEDGRPPVEQIRSEERRVGKECRYPW